MIKLTYKVVAAKPSKTNSLATPEKLSAKTMIEKLLQSSKVTYSNLFNQIFQFYTDPKTPESKSSIRGEAMCSWARPKQGENETCKVTTFLPRFNSKNNQDHKGLSSAFFYCILEKMAEITNSQTLNVIVDAVDAKTLSFYEKLSCCSDINKQLNDKTGFYSLTMTYTAEAGIDLTQIEEEETSPLKLLSPVPNQSSGNKGAFFIDSPEKSG